MKKILRLLSVVGLMIILCCDICYADMVDPMSRFIGQEVKEVKEVLTDNIVQIIIIGVIIIAIVVGAIKVLTKNNLKKNIKVNNEITEETKEKTE